MTDEVTEAMVEKVARIIDPRAFGCRALNDGTIVVSLPQAAEAARQKARDIIAAMRAAAPVRDDAGVVGALRVIVANAALIPDPATGELTDCYAVPIDDIEAALAALQAAQPGTSSEGGK